MKAPVWYTHVEGKGLSNPQLTGAFGFFVHGVVMASSESVAMQRFSDELASDSLIIVEVRHIGKIQDIEWSDEKKRSEIQRLAEKACANPSDVFFSTFDSWPIEDC